MRPLIDQKLSVVFYDLTTVRVHGEAGTDGDVRTCGLSKEGGVARQFVLSLVQTADGLPVAHQVHPGNTAEATEVRHFEAIFGDFRRAGRFRSRTCERSVETLVVARSCDARIGMLQLS